MQITSIEADVIETFSILKEYVFLEIEGLKSSQPHDLFHLQFCRRAFIEQTFNIT